MEKLYLGNFEGYISEKSGTKRFRLWSLGQSDGGGEVIRVNIAKCKEIAWANNELSFKCGWRDYQFSFGDSVCGVSPVCFSSKLFGLIPLAWGKGEINGAGKNSILVHFGVSS